MTGYGLSRPEGSAMPFWVLVSAGQYLYEIWSLKSGFTMRRHLAIADLLLFTEPYLLRFPAVDGATWSKGGSFGLIFPRPFFLYLFRRRGVQICVLGTSTIVIVAQK
ncbi:blue copper protein-like [Dorcoceras hygrometricum]|uniref:Blue copper protein-like n=1 Tax=Dorcoceras hygrometricum TaxID=472368 RepID=A0A2Z7AT78_9LAMI|nr:blue copper protein-like [Dorcoceras hygrometricum]